MKEDFPDEYRCSCGKLLFKGQDLSGIIEIKCKRCGHIKSIGGGANSLLLRDAGSSGYNGIGTGEMAKVAIME